MFGTRDVYWACRDSIRDAFVLWLEAERDPANDGVFYTREEVDQVPAEVIAEGCANFFGSLLEEVPGIIVRDLPPEEITYSFELRDLKEIFWNWECRRRQDPDRFWDNSEMAKADPDEYAELATAAFFRTWERLRGPGRFPGLPPGEILTG